MLSRASRGKAEGMTFASTSLSGFLAPGRCICEPKPQTSEMNSSNPIGRYGLLSRSTKQMPCSIGIGAYVHLLKTYKALTQRNQILSHMLVTGDYGDDYFLSTLVHSLFKTRTPQLASLVFNWSDQRSSLLWTSMIRGYSSCYGSDSLLYYVEMRRRRFYPNNFNIPFALKSCGVSKSLSTAQQIHTDIVKLGFVSDVFVQTALLDVYVKSSRLDTAQRVFDYMSVKTVVSWTAILSGYCRDGLLEHAQKVFDEMPIRNMVSWNVMVDGFARYGHLERAQLYFDCMPQRNAVSWTSMIGGYSKAGNVDKARWIFDQMVEKEVIAWTAMMTCYVQNGKPHDAIKLFNQMLEARIKLDEVTMLTIITAVSQVGSLQLCTWIQSCIFGSGFKYDIRILNATITMYVQCGSIERAFEIFQKMPIKDVVSYNSMITGYASHGDAKQAFSLFSTMTRDNVLPNSITFISLLNVCAHRGLLEEGQRYFHLLLDAGYVELKSEHYACMVDLLGRAGHLDEAHDLILGMPVKPSASTWGALLGACRILGNIDLAEAVSKRLFEIEPGNSGNYAILANMYADKRMWHSAANARRVMKEKSLIKTLGSSWAEGMAPPEFLSIQVSFRKIPSLMEEYQYCRKYPFHLKHGLGRNNRILALRSTSSSELKRTLSRLMRRGHLFHIVDIQNDQCYIQLDLSSELSEI